MEEFRYYSAEKVICENLREITHRMEMLGEQDLAHICELAAEITGDIEDGPDLAASIRDILPNEPELSAPLLFGAERTRRQVLLCMELQKQLQKKREIHPEMFFPEPDELDEAALSCIAYQRSSYADTAYLQFAKQLALPRAHYAHSFQEACEAVFNGLCEYCILPIESSSEGLLNSFSRLIDRYRLKIAATCDILADASRTTRFALLQRDMLPLLKDPKSTRFFEFSFALNDAISPGAILQAAELCGMRPVRLDSHPQGDGLSHTHVHCVIRIGDGALSAFLLYLAMQVPEHEPIGIYPRLPR